MASPKQCKEERVKLADPFIPSYKGWEKKKPVRKKKSFILYLTIVEVIQQIIFQRSVTQLAS